MITIGLTGGFGTGKSTVAKMFTQEGAVVLDADQLVHESLAPAGNSYSKVVREFGKAILEGKTISRPLLAGIVFNNPKKLKKLTSIVHPIVLKEVQSKIQKLKKDRKVRIVVVDAPLLIEAGWHLWVDYVIVIKASRPLQIRRIQAVKNLSRAQILRRIKAQMPITQKINMADIVIDNRKSLNETRKHVQKIADVLKNRAS